MEKAGTHSRRQIIRASEVAQYVYCHRAWWLNRVRGYRPANESELDQGHVAHRRHGRKVRVWQGARRVATGSLLLGLLMLILSLCLMARGI